MPCSSGNGTEARDDAHDSAAADGNGGGAAKQARRDAAAGAGASAGGGGSGKGVSPKRPGDDIVRCSAPCGSCQCFILREGVIEQRILQHWSKSQRITAWSRQPESRVICRPRIHLEQSSLLGNFLLHSMDGLAGCSPESLYMGANGARVRCPVVQAELAHDHVAPFFTACLAVAVGCHPPPAASQRRSRRASASSRAATR